MGPEIFIFNGVLAGIILLLSLLHGDLSSGVFGFWMITVCLCGIKATT